MLISPLNMYNSNFKGGVSKRAVYASKNITESNTINSVLSSIRMTGGISTIDNAFSAHNITYCEPNGTILEIMSGYNGGFFKIDVGEVLTSMQAKLAVALSLMSERISLGGFKNYKKMVSDLKRQDIIQKSLKAHTYGLNGFISVEQIKTAAKVLSKISKKHVLPKDIFILGNDAHYYDYLDKAVFSVNALSKTESGMKNTGRVCKYEFNKNGHIIGYKRKENDIFVSGNSEKIYMEQQEISEELPSITDIENNKLFAESFRFGNAEPNRKQRYAIPNVKSHLSARVGILNPKDEDLHFVKVYDKDKNIISRICYYDSSVGRSLVYNDEGKYLYQMEYIKDDYGNILACTRY